MREKVISLIGRKEAYLLITAAIIIITILVGSSISGLANPNTKTASHKYYTSVTIEKGDTLWSIASEYMSPEYDGIEDYIMEVRTINHLYSDGIYAGEDEKCIHFLSYSIKHKLQSPVQSVPVPATQFHRISYSYILRKK